MKRARRSGRSCRWSGLILAMVGLTVCFPPREAQGQLHFGPQIAAGTDSSLGLGGRVVFVPRTGGRALDGVLEGIRFFQGDVDSWIDLNLNLRLSLPLAQDFATRVGGGLNVAVISVDEVGSPSTRTDTSVGLNLLAAFEYPREGILGGRAVPFAEARVVAGGGEQFVFTLGMTFGSAAEP